MNELSSENVSSQSKKYRNLKFISQSEYADSKGEKNTRIRIFIFQRQKF